MTRPLGSCALERSALCFRLTPRLRDYAVQLLGVGVLVEPGSVIEVRVGFVIVVVARVRYPRLWMKIVKRRDVVVVRRDEDYMGSVAFADANRVHRAFRKYPC